jgi:hypothetical protein
MRALAILWLLLLTSVTVALASDWGFVPPPEPAWGPPRCNLGSVLESSTGTIHGAVICESPLGVQIIDHDTGEHCDKLCQQLCFQREGK